MKKIAITIPVYNAEKTIQRCLDSILNQTYKNYVVIVFDDCSTDKTWEILNRYDNPKLKIFKNQTNHGCVENRNFLLRYCMHKIKPDYIALQDADDWSKLERMEKQITFLENNPEYGLCGTQFYWHQNGSERKVTRPETDEEIRAGYYYSSVMAHGTLMVRKEVYDDVGLYDPYFVWSHDNDWITRLLYGKKWLVRNLPEHLYHVWVTKYTESKTPERLAYRQKNRYKRYCECVGIEYDEKNFKLL